MSDDRASLLRAVSQLGVGLVALLLLGGVLYSNQQDRRYEAERADQDRNIMLEMTRQIAIDGAKRADIVLRQQEEELKQGDQIATAILAQGKIIEQLAAFQRKNISALVTHVERAELRKEMENSGRHALPDTK